MKIITSKQSQALDQATIKREPIASIDLMERAGKRIAHKLLKEYDDVMTFIVLCGNGNNGGDGLVIARLLHKANYCVNVYVDSKAEDKSPENLENLRRLKAACCPCYNMDDLRRHEKVVWIDALFGSGLSRPLDGKWKDIIEIINSFDGEKVAVDIPSGLYSDELPLDNQTILYCDKTYSIGQPKLSFFFPESAKYVGDFAIINIDLDPSYLQELSSSNYYVTNELIQRIYHPRKRFSHKGTYGHALIIGGSYGKIGASILATTAVLKAGVGLATCYLPSCGYNVIQQVVPEAMCITDQGEKFIHQFPNIDKYNAIGIGCGLGQEEKTQEAFYDWLSTHSIQEGSLVIDADGLNLLSKNKPLLKNLPNQTILTPHPKEFERLAGRTKNSLERLHLAQKFAEENKVILVLKDTITCVINPSGEVYYNSTGNAGLATGGSGDTLTGIITSLLAQGYSAQHASILGVWLHGKSADIGLKNESMETFTATDITKYLGKAFKSIIE